jgi:ABC-type hemin transport system ATPase subunit
VITLSALGCRISGATLLQDISLTLRGGCVAVIGPNGAGKSTLLRLCADGGRHLPRASLTGDIRLDGRPLRELPADALAQRRAFLPQHHAESLRLPVASILELAMWPHGQPALHAQALREAVRLWELDSLAARPYDELSGGERQRVQLARTWLQMKLHAEPRGRIWLLDEPQTGLDLPHQQRLRECLRREADAGALVMFSTHDLNFALRAADTFVALRDGRLLFAGAAGELANAALLKQVFDVDFDTLLHPGDSRAWLVPR